MIKSVAELQEFIKWAKSNKINHFKVDNIEITFFPQAMIDLAESTEINLDDLNNLGTGSWADEIPVNKDAASEEEEALYHSTEW